METLFDKFQIPDRYTIGGQEYKVVQQEVVRDEDDDPVFGLHSPSEAKITIAHKFPITDTLKARFLQKIRLLIVSFTRCFIHLTL